MLIEKSSWPENIVPNNKNWMPIFGPKYVGQQNFLIKKNLVIWSEEISSQKNV